MSRLAIVLVSVAALPFGQDADAQHVVSYHAQGATDPGFVIIPEVPAGGFVLTDVILADMSNTEFRLTEGAGSVKLKFFASAAIAAGVHLDSGIPFTPGSAVTVVTSQLIND